jgi:hypothetical protein
MLNSELVSVGTLLLGALIALLKGVLPLLQERERRASSDSVFSKEDVDPLDLGSCKEESVTPKPGKGLESHQFGPTVPGGLYDDWK